MAINFQLKISGVILSTVVSGEQTDELLVYKIKSVTIIQF
jgi:hypothetical protein